MPQDLLRLLCLTLALVFTGAGVGAAPAVDTQLWSANGPVRVTATNDDVSHLFIDGQFSYSDPGTGAMAIDAQSGVFDTDFPHIDGPVYAVVSDTAGGWYLGGHFSTVGGVSRHNLVHVAWDSAAGWSVADWNPHPEGIVYALALSSDAATLYVGGDFATLNNGVTVRHSLAAVTTTLTATATAWDPDLDGAVRALLLSADDGTLYVGGDFTHAGGGSVTRNHAAAFDVAQDGAVLAWHPNANGSVYALTVSGSRLYLGGAFTELNGGAVPRAHVAAVGLVSADVDAAWNPGPDQAVRALAVANGRVYLGGDFSTLNAGSTSQPYLAAVDNGAGLIDGGWRPGLDAAVHSLQTSPTGELYVGGDFSHVDGQQRNRLAVLDQTTATLGDWQPSSWTTVHALGGSGSTLLAAGGFDRLSRSLLYIGGDFDYVGPATGSGVAIDGNGDVDTTLPPVDGHVYAVVADAGGGWYIGGDFSAVGGVARSNLAHIDGSGGLGPWSPAADGPVYDLALSGSGSLFVGGAFTTINGNARSYLAEVATADGSLSGWDPQAAGVVRTLALSGTTLYAGGDFFSPDGMAPSIGGQPRDYVAALDTVSGNALLAWDAAVDGPVYSLSVSAAGTLYLGGAFTHVNAGVSRPYLAEVDTADGIDTGWDAQATGVVRDVTLSVDGATLYVGGDFFSVDGTTPSLGGQPRDYVAALDTGSGNALSGWQADTDAPVHVLSLAPGPPELLYVGGEFTQIAGISRNRLALLTATNGQPTDWNPSVGAGVDAIAGQSGNVFVGGGFASVGGVTRRHVAALDLTSGQATDWNPGVDGPVHTLLVSGSRVYVGGQFTAAGGQYRRNLAALDTATGVATGWDPDADDTVYALLPAANNVTLYVAGAFTELGGLARNGLAEVDVNGAPTGWAPVFDSGAAVHALALSGTTLYAGGTFTISDSAGVVILTRNLAAFNIVGAALLPWRPAVDGGVRDLLLSADASRLYLGGDFTVVDGQSRLHVAALDTQAEIPGQYVTAWNADSGSPGDSVRVLAMSADRTTLYVGGDFTAIAGGARSNIAALRVFDATLLGSWSVTPDAGVDALSVARDAIYVGGRYRTIEGLPRAHLAAFATPPAETQPPVTTVSLPGGSYTSATLDAIALYCDDGLGSGCATTYYAVNDGPWIIYSGPLTFNEDTTLRYFSVDNVGNSEDITVNQQSYIIEIKPPETTISPATKVYNSETLTLSMSCSDDKSGCAATYYTLDDSTPTTASRRYTGPFTIRGRTVVKFFSVDQVGNREDIQRASYVSSFGGSGRLTLLALLPWVAVLLIRSLSARRREAVDV